MYILLTENNQVTVLLFFVQVVGVEPLLLEIHLFHSIFFIIPIMYNTGGQQQKIFIQQAIRGSKDLYAKCYFNKFNKQPDYNETVLCSISLYSSVTKKLQIASVGFGTKSLPYKTAAQNKGKVIKDMHAQVLAKKGFIKYLINHKPAPKSQNQIFKWDNIKQKHYLQEEFRVVMYVNEVFCGDCMINMEQNLFSGAKPLKYFADKQIPQDKFSQYCLRTKPGRLDLPLQKRSLSLSCSDKFGVWNILGIQGKKLFNYIRPIYINFIALETQRKVNLQRIKQGINFTYRISKLRGFSSQKIRNKLFKIVVEGKTKYITKQFRCNQPEILLTNIKKQQNQSQKNQREQKSKQKQSKLPLCGVYSCNEISWLSGKTGLPEGVNIKKINKVSPFCSEELYQNINSLQNQQFKYHAVKDRIKLLFGEWTDKFKN